MKITGFENVEFADKKTLERLATDKMTLAEKSILVKGVLEALNIQGLFFLRDNSGTYHFYDMSIKKDKKYGDEI